jgi:hypothetical protein
VTLKEAKTLKPGDTVIWPEGARGCKEARGVVKYDAQVDSFYVEWVDGQLTYLHDKNAVKYIRRMP